MNRRSFIAAIAGALTLDPERALWVPGAKTISIPKPAVLRYDLLFSELTVLSEIKIDEYLAVLRNNTEVFYANLANRARVHKIGDTIMIRTPRRFSTRDIVGLHG